MEEIIFWKNTTLYESKEWKIIEDRENDLGFEKLYEEIMEKKIWSNAEIMWIIRKMIGFYGQNDSFLKAVPQERLLLNMTNLLKVFYIIIDQQNPDIDNNLRSFISGKLLEATWGINPETKKYLDKMP